MICPQRTAICSMPLTLGCVQSAEISVGSPNSCRPSVNIRRSAAYLRTIRRIFSASSCSASSPLNTKIDVANTGRGSAARICVNRSILRSNSASSSLRFSPTALIPISTEAKSQSLRDMRDIPPSPLPSTHTRQIPDSDNLSPAAVRSGMHRNPAGSIRDFHV